MRPKALSRVVSKELAEFVGYCIQPRADRPKSRQLLKHPYFDSIRAERCSVKLSAEALGIPVPAADGTSELADYANSAGSSSVSRTSSAAGKPSRNLTSTETSGDNHCAPRANFDCFRDSLTKLASLQLRRLVVRKGLPCFRLLLANSN